jgi:hypothetical protein
MENKGSSDFPITVYRQLPDESKQLLKLIYRNLALIQNSIATKKSGPKKGKKAKGI